MSSTLKFCYWFLIFWSSEAVLNTYMKTNIKTTIIIFLLWSNMINTVFFWISSIWVVIQTQKWGQAEWAVPQYQEEISISCAACKTDKFIENLLQELGEQLVMVVDQLKVPLVLGLGEGAGANILARSPENYHLKFMISCQRLVWWQWWGMYHNKYHKF